MARRPDRTRSVWTTVRGTVTLVIGALVILFAYFGAWPEALVAGVAALLLSLVGLLTVRLTRPKLTVTREFSPPIVSAGTPVRVVLGIANAGARSTPPGEWNDSLPWHESQRPQPLPALGSTMEQVAAGAGSGRRARAIAFEYELHPEQRGVYPVGPLAVEHRDPFGMARSVTAQGGRDDLVVVPELVSLPPGALSTAEAEGNALLVQRRVTGNDDDLTTREYRPGDALRRVHWRASARHGELMVRQEEQRSYPKVRLLLDTRRDGYSDAAPDGLADSAADESESFEWIVRFFASLSLHLFDRGFDVQVHETAEPQVATFGDRWEGMQRDQRFLRSLAGIHLVTTTSREAPEPPPTSDAPGPVFALLASPSTPTLDWMRRQRRPGEAAVAWMLGGHNDDAREVLRASGWTVANPALWDDPVEAWLQAHEMYGISRGSR
ncbi:DUF58 domain-containing protein [Schumannella sp. 10F1B-5-1]|uniref:DUF58 domain-containing protein n=1 Tax=Schumannella sp. 10F1B-5-1 TaxID=2590780 RepID=UPI0011307350|nr:DUF58 domain-containing protein [Schumannella sp. 10F1B-5-1]TPW72297.1 DUF58 domain-containing protein [Schumannella sp. 10F1B-5-1]